MESSSSSYGISRKHIPHHQMCCLLPPHSSSASQVPDSFLSYFWIQISFFLAFNSNAYSFYQYQILFNICSFQTRNPKFLITNINETYVSHLENISKPRFLFIFPSFTTLLQLTVELFLCLVEFSVHVVQYHGWCSVAWQWASLVVGLLPII